MQPGKPEERKGEESQQWLLWGLGLCWPLWACLGRLSYSAPGPALPHQPQGAKSSGVILSFLPRVALKGQSLLPGLMFTLPVHQYTQMTVCVNTGDWLGGR